MEARLPTMGRIGVAFPGDPAHRATWSGTPAGVIRGLTECGAEVVPIRAEPDALVREAAHNLLALPYLRPQRDWRAAVKRARAASRASPGLAWVEHEGGPGRCGAPAGSTASFRSARASAPHRRAGRDVRGHDGPPDQDASVSRLGPALASVLRGSRRAPAPRLRRGGRVLPDQPLGGGVGDPRLRRRAGEGPRGRRRAQPQAPPRAGARLERAALLVRRARLGAQERRWRRCARSPACARSCPDARLDLVGGHPPVDAPGVTGHGILRLDVPEQHAPRAAVRRRHLFRHAVALGGVGDRLRRGRGGRPAEHRHEPGRLGLPDRRRRPDRRPARRRGPARRHAAALGR